MPKPSLSLDASLNQLNTLVRNTRELALSHHRRALPSMKTDGSPVTECDVAMERALVAGLAESFPDDSVVCEEGSVRTGSSGAVWHVDPIDGTGAFVQGLAYWGPTLCRVSADGQLDLGVFYAPLLDELFSAGAGLGAWRDDVRLPAAHQGPIAHDDYLFAPSRMHLRPGLPWPGKVRSLGSTAAHLALVAAGGGRGAIVSQWSLWDVGCGVLLNTEVGNVVTTLDGTSVDPAVCKEGLPLIVGARTAVEILDTGGWATRAAAPSRNDHARQR
jgi:fructose-1,6-bisphosphatase/inositol monophosphatase family enzyme